MEAIRATSWTAFELPGVHVAIKAPFKADIAFIDDPEARTQ